MKRLELSTTYSVHTILYGRNSTSIDLEVRRSKVKVTWLTVASEVLCYGRGAGAGLHVVRLLGFLVVP